MCEKTKLQTEVEKKDSEKVESPEHLPAQKADYYYDDAHGYEIYQPDEDEETDEN